MSNASVVMLECDRLGGRPIAPAVTQSPLTGKSAECPTFLPVGRGGEESRPYNHTYISRKPQPCLPRLNGVGGELHFKMV
jgi:hypothetical protein